MPDIVEIKAQAKRNFEKNGNGFLNLGDFTVEYVWSAFDGKYIFDICNSEHERLDDREAQTTLDNRSRYPQTPGAKAAVARVVKTLA